MAARLENLRRVVFWPANNAPLAVCGRCGCVIVDDDEGANRGEHEDWHEAIESNARGES